MMTGQSPQREPTRQGVLRAAEKVAAILPSTPLLPLEHEGRTIWCKAECLQPIGAFKIRGAWHRLSDLDAAERVAGVVAFSSGNHAQGVAWAARRLGMPAVIVMPADAPRKKVESTRALGAEVIFYDRMTGKREEIAGALASERGATLVPSFDDAWVIEGQGSLGIEILAQMERQAGGAPDAIIAPGGGGGLISGQALACPDAAIHVVEPEGWDDIALSLAAGEIVPVRPNPPPTSCDAIQTLRISPLTFAVMKQYGVQAHAVTEAEIAHAMRTVFNQLRVVVEPGGAAGLAAVLAGKIPIGERSAVVLSGGNVDPDMFARVLAGGTAL